MSSDPVFHAYRSFSTLRNRLLLLKQNELSGLEMELNNLDEDDAADLDIDLYRARDYKNGSEKRRVLIEKIESADKEYGAYTPQPTLGSFVWRTYLRTLI